MLCAPPPPPPPLLPAPPAAHRHRPPRPWLSASPNPWSEPEPWFSFLSGLSCPHLHPLPLGCFPADPAESFTKLSTYTSQSSSEPACVQRQACPLARSGHSRPPWCLGSSSLGPRARVAGRWPADTATPARALTKPRAKVLPRRPGRRGLASSQSDAFCRKQGKALPPQGAPGSASR